MTSLEDIYYQGYLINLVENKILDLFSEGKLQGTTHTCIGQELNAVLSIWDLKKDDIVISNHRGHGHYIAKTGDIHGLLAEVMGLESGICGGKGGSQHLCNTEYNFFSNGVLGNMIPVAAGMSFAEKDSGNIVTAFLGDGALGEGVVYETFNLCSLLSLPILFILENNGYAQSTKMEHSFSGSISERVTGFGLEYALIERGKDPLESLDIILEAQNNVRQGNPWLVEMESYRLSPHSKGDDYRDSSEIESFSQSNPLRLLRKELNDPEEVEKRANNALRRVVEQFPS